MRRSITVGPGRRVATVLLAVALATSLLAPVAVAAPAPNAPRAGQAAAPLTNLAHLDFLSARVAVPNMAAHSTYRLAQEPRVGVLWVYAQANDDDDIARASVGYLRQCRATGDVHAKEQAYQQLRGLTYLQTLTGPKAGEAVLWIQPDGSLHASATRRTVPIPTRTWPYWPRPGYRGRTADRCHADAGDLATGCGVGRLGAGSREIHAQILPHRVRVDGDGVSDGDSVCRIRKTPSGMLARAGAGPPAVRRWRRRCASEAMTNRRLQTGDDTQAIHARQ